MFGLTPYVKRNNQLTAGKPRDIFDLFFGDDFFPSFTSGFTANFHADIRDTGNEYVIEAEMPGMAKDDIKLELDGDVLTISAEKKESSDEERGSYIRRERRYGSFARSFRVEGIDNEGINAAFDNGLLRLTLPKLTPEAGGKTEIEIQ